MEACDSVILEMEGLSSQVSDNDFTSNAKMNRSLSRKASNWGERKLPEERDNDASSFIKGGGGGLSDGAVKTIAFPVGVESTTTRSAESRGIRRYTSTGRRSSSLVDPRRVLFFFATLSSMGTLILIYFTLSVAKINGDDDIAFQS